MPENQTTQYGALPPADAIHQIGDRADKACVIAALEVLQFEVGRTVTFDLTQKAIDAYLVSAAQHGWKLT